MQSSTGTESIVRVTAGSNGAAAARVRTAVEERPTPVRGSHHERPTAFSIGRLAPLALVAWALLDVGLRFSPLDWLRLNPVQVATRRPGRYAPFAPNLKIAHPELTGELALLGNLPPSEPGRPIRFTTDALGFRANPAAAGKPAEILVFEGDSFTFGAGLSDDETFPAALARELDVGVYNGGRFFTDPERLIELDWLLGRLGHKPHTMIYLLMESVDLNAAWEYDQGAIDRAGRRLIGDPVYSLSKDALRYVNRFVRLSTEISPLKIVSQRGYKWLADDSKLPNPYKTRVQERTLPDGQRFLVEPRYVERHLHPPDDRTLRNTADYVAAFGEQVRARGMDFWVLLIPEALSVYERWLLRPDERPAEAGPYLDRMERELAARGVRIINGLEALRPWAAEDAATGRLSYFREDHHWTPLGVDRIAVATAGALRRARMPTTQSDGEIVMAGSGETARTAAAPVRP